MRVLRDEVDKLPVEAREPALTLVTTIVDFSGGDGALGEVKAKPRRLVILVHGILTRAEWQGRIRSLFEADGQTDVEALGYGYFDALRFLCPFITRRAPIVEVERNIRDALKIHASHSEVVFVGHSFGTYILGKILSERPDISPDRVLLCGSILSRKFRWDKLPNRPHGVLNEVGSRDIWPILAHSTTWGYGSTGTFGFKTAGVRDRYHDCAHSDYFEPGFAEKYWLPWITTGTVVPSAFETGPQAPTPLLKNLLELVPIKYVLIFVLVIAVWFVLH
jgi:pimeloyl-ACP methyl ester carboxylesterase